MKLVSFVSTVSQFPKNLVHVGIQSSTGGILDLTTGALQIPDMLTLIDRYRESQFNTQLKEYAVEIEKSTPSSTLPMIESRFVRIVAPIPRPRRNVMCVGKLLVLKKYNHHTLVLLSGTLLQIHIVFLFVYIHVVR